jgi:tetratricopeptide (TPR) repeat protein
MTGDRWLTLIVAGLCFSTLLAFGATAQAASKRASSKATCPALRDDASRINDYRLRGSSDFMRFSIEDNWTNHTKPAIDRIRAGDFSQPVIADLDFTLRGWPNHPLALGALVDYVVGGGKLYGFPAAQCYFVHAQRWYPDDPTVFMLEGRYYWKIGEIDEARLAYLDALALNDSLVEVHYNLGLVYLELKQMQLALEHAKRAYAGGYPLPGLRRKLVEAGVWEEGSRAAGDNPQ